ncbi:MAG: hypothetical protein JSV24_02925 [Bacteroidales bacterium]|nr:MAG: hypothetical protein JSV24_02925 [Bacteroidales bacterium]
MVFLAGDNIISALGFSTSENVGKIIRGYCGINVSDDARLYPEPLYISCVETRILENEISKIHLQKEYTRFEKLAILSISDALQRSQIEIGHQNTLIIISTTKGNINLLDKTQAAKYDKQRIHLWSAAQEIQRYFKNPNTPLVVSNACISGLMAVIVARRLLKTGKYSNVVITGVDIMSEFIISGFQSFQAISPEPCKPFDLNRSGITVGEGAGTIILTSKPTGLNGDHRICISGGASSNDANHISGPSRTGDGLYFAIKHAMQEAGVGKDEIDYISAHGTGTDFNDEMEAKAIAWASLENKPVNSYKGYFGHTMGAAGVIESILGIQSLIRNELFPSMGFEKLGVSEDLNIIRERKHIPLSYCLKLGSGFGGCNAAVVYRKESMNQ